MHARGAERIAGEREHERRIDAAREPDHDALEAVLADVVAHAEHERAPDAFLAAPAAAPGSPARGRSRSSAWTTSSGRERFLEGRRAMHDAPVRVHGKAAAVEDELVLAADEVQVRRTARPCLPRARREIRLALRLLALLERRGIEREHEIARRRARAPRGDVGVPDVLADDRRDPHAVRARPRRTPSPGLEVALLVEHLVVRQPLLAVVRDAPPVAEPGRGVEDRAVRVFRIADQQVDAARGVREPRQRLVDAPAEAAVEQQVFGRIAATARAPGSRRARRRPGALPRAARRSRAALPGTSPTVGSICASAMRTRRQRLRLRRRQAASAFFIALPSSAGERTVATPASSSAAYLSAAVPLPPAITAPAWPMRLPAGAVTPAM